MSELALLLSGGMDSIALAWALKPSLAITIDYGQMPAAGEIRAAAAVCTSLGIRHRIVRADCTEVGSGDLIGRSADPLAPSSEWWPYRNQLLITLAASAAIQEGLTRLAFGAVSTDGSHVDGRSEFFQALNQVLGLQEGRLTVETPAIEQTTVEFCRRVQVPFDILAWSHSCHAAEYACGNCRGCNKHRQCMRELGYGDY